MTISIYILAPAIAWFVAQGAKYIIDAYKKRSWRNLRRLYLSGNMPSAHSATVTALLTVVYFKDGSDSAIFGVTALFAAIIIYDAVMLRRSSGEQGGALVRLLREVNSKIAEPRVAKGHTPVEALVGSLLGIGIALVVILATKNF